MAFLHIISVAPCGGLHNLAQPQKYGSIGPYITTIKNSTQADIRSMRGLGFPPITYTQNASECLKRYVINLIQRHCDVTVRINCSLFCLFNIVCIHCLMFTNRYVKENAEDSTNVGRSLVEAVSNIQSVVNRQFDEQFLAVIGKGCYQLAEGFKHLGVEENHFYQMSENQKQKEEEIIFRGNNLRLYKSAKKRGR